MPEPKPDRRRKYPRIRVPKGMFFGWKSPGHHTVSSAHDLGLGGVFLFTPSPAAIGATIELIFDVANGEVRARAVVRRVGTAPAHGMGIEFIAMNPEDRARLSHMLTPLLASN